MGEDTAFEYLDKRVEGNAVSLDYDVGDEELERGDIFVNGWTG